MPSLPFSELAGLALALAAVGCLSGFLAGLLGIGGGIVVVPALYFVLSAFGIAPELQPHVAVGTSLATIIPTSILSMRTHSAKGAVDTDLLRRWAVWIAVGVLAGIAIAASVKGLGLRRRHQTVEVADTPEIRGMIYVANHMLKVERS